MTPMGSSGGRSARNRTGEGARRRATPRERQQIDPPADQLVRAFPEPLKRASWLVVVSLVALVAGFALVLVLGLH